MTQDTAEAARATRAQGTPWQSMSMNRIGIPPGTTATCAACGRTIDGRQPAAPLQGLTIHAVCAAYRRLRVRG
jgi:hypothetical protein